MRRPLAIVIALAVALLALMWGYGALVAPYSAPGGWGMGPHMMAHPWGGPSTMRGYGWGTMGARWNSGWPGRTLSTDDVKTYLERWIAWQRNSRLKVGEVKEKDADTIVADVVTRDNSLVQRFLVNRQSGYFQPSED